MKLREIVEAIESEAPIQLAEEWDNSGLQIGLLEMDVRQALLCVDLTEAVFDEALENGCNLIITHHPLFFHPLRRLCDSNMAERIAARAIREGIAIYSAHTNLDNSPVGLNARLAWRLCLTDTQILKPMAQNAQAGSGMIGRMARPMDETNFLRQLKQVLQVPDVRHSDLTGSQVERVAVCGGAGGFLIEDAIKQGAQVLVTADLRHHDFIDADHRILLAEVGHFESEQCAKEVFFDILSKKMPNFAVRFAETDRSPINHL